MWLPKLRFTRRLVREILPQVDRELTHWRRQAEAIPDPELRSQALASIRHKRFHCEGGAVYGLFAGGARTTRLVRLICALQTISDYLDNLCDRSVSLEMRAYRRLHRAMLDAVSTGPALGGYYDDLQQADDGGYLQALVHCCREQLAGLPGYPQVAASVWRLASRYCDLQVLKHGPRHLREPLLKAWHRRHEAGEGAQVTWYEFAAACGSTLGMFALFALAAQPPDAFDPHHLGQTLAVYMPWLCALHILLDYWIDQEEDRIGGDLNFTAFYPDASTAAARLRFLFERALAGVQTLPGGALHHLIVQGLPSLYLSDGKAARNGLAPHIGPLLEAGGLGTRVTFAVCKWRRSKQPGDGAVQAPPAVPRR